MPVSFRSFGGLIPAFAEGCGFLVAWRCLNCALQLAMSRHISGKKPENDAGYAHQRSSGTQRQGFGGI